MQPHGGDRTVRKGPWTAEEDEVLLQHVREHGPREWSSIRSKGLLPRTGKSCRLRWVNKLRPNLKTGCKFSPEEEQVVIDMQAQFGNKWAKISTYLPGRTDNDVKNFWSTRQKRLARILRAALPGRRSGKNTCNYTEPSSHGLPTPKDLCMDLIPFQQMHSTGQCSQEPCLENNCATAPFPGPPDFIAALPPSFEFAMDAAECCSSSTVPMTQPSFNDTAAPVYDVDALGFVHVGSLDDDLAYLEPLAEVQPPQFFGLDQDMSEVFFDDLPSEMFDFFEPPSQPPPPPPPSPQSKQL